MNTQIKLLFASTIFSSAFLLFLVQPLISKHILPWFGGSAAVWDESRRIEDTHRGVLDSALANPLRYPPPHDAHLVVVSSGVSRAAALAAGFRAYIG